MKEQDKTFFDARGQEFYELTGLPVYPSRNLFKPPDSERPLSEEVDVLNLLYRLGELEKRTRPDGGPLTSRDKDLAAFDALSAAGRLVKYVAGWAIDHEIGLAIEGLQFVPFEPQTQNHPDYVKHKASVDRHEHERRGALGVDGGDEAQLLRNCLINLLRGNSGGWPDWLCYIAIDALEALEFGEVHPIFERNSAGKKRDFTQRKLMLRAISMVQFRRTAYGVSKDEAREEVGAAINASPNTIKSWEVRLKAEIPLKVERALASAKNCGTFVANESKRLRLGETDNPYVANIVGRAYDRESLERLGKKFKAALSRT